MGTAVPDDYSRVPNEAQDRRRNEAYLVVDVKLVAVLAQQPAPRFGQGEYAWQSRETKQYLAQGVERLLISHEYVYMDPTTFICFDLR
jgi:hypothetical protein